MKHNLIGQLSMCILGIALTGTLSQAAPTKSSISNKAPSLNLGGKGSDFFPEGEKIVYQKILTAYQKSDLVGIYRERDLLLKYYPKSVHADNALYLTGLLDLQKGRFGEALKNFNKITNEYALGNKVAGALFAKGVTYKRLNLKQQAHSVLMKVIKEFPNSPESQRAEMEIRLLEKKTS